MASSISSPVSSDEAVSIRALTGPAGEPLLHDIDLDLRAQATLVVVGSLHAGKSMLMRHLVGLEIAERGTIEISGITVDAARPDPGAQREAQGRLGVVFEGPSLLRFATAAENVELPIAEHQRLSRADIRSKAEALLDEAGFTGNPDSEAGELDRVGRRHVELARALSLDPDTLILDEPTAGFDADASHHFDGALERIQTRRGVAIMILSRDARHVYRPGAEIVVMADGRVVARGERADLVTSDDPAVRRFLHRRGGE